MQNNEMLKVDEAASLVRVHKNTILNWVRKGEIPSQKIGRTIRIRYSDLIQYSTPKGDQ